MILGDRLRAIREARGFSLAEIAGRSGVSGSFLTRVETGHVVPAMETIEALAAALLVPVEDLFYEGEEPPRLENLTNRLTADDVARITTRKKLGFLGKLR